MTYDNYKLATPPESDLCIYCDESEIRGIARERFEASIVDMPEDHEPAMDEDAFYLQERDQHGMCACCNDND